MCMKLVKCVFTPTRGLSPTRGLLPTHVLSPTRGLLGSEDTSEPRAVGTAHIQERV